MSRSQRVHTRSLLLPALALAIVASWQPAGSEILSVGAEFQVNTYTLRVQYRSVIAPGASGGFIVAWMDGAATGFPSQDGSGAAVYAQRFGSSGAPLAGEFRVNSATEGGQGLPSIASDSAGNFVIVWAGPAPGRLGSAIFGQRYSKTGARKGGEFRVNTNTLLDPEFPAVAMDPSGSFLVAWSGSGSDGTGFGVAARRYGSSGSALGAEFVVNTYVSRDQRFPVAAADGSGGFAVVWSSLLQDGSERGIFGQILDASGSPVGNEFQVNIWTTGRQDGSDWGVFAQSLCNDQDGDLLCDGGAGSFELTSPMPGGTLDCSDPLTIRPTFTWRGAPTISSRSSSRRIPASPRGTL